jgi:hypothetical protein
VLVSVESHATSSSVVRRFVLPLSLSQPKAVAPVGCNPESAWVQRRRPGQTIHDDGEGAIPIDLHERAGVRQRRRTLWATRRVPLREAVETAMWAKFHVDEEAGAGGGCLGYSSLCKMCPDVSCLPIKFP